MPLFRPRTLLLASTLLLTISFSACGTISTEGVEWRYDHSASANGNSKPRQYGGC